MDDLIKYLNENLYLNNFKILKTGINKCVIFKIYYKYTKCIYIELEGNMIHVNVDKVFDSNIYSLGIERLLISSNIFSDYGDILSYIQKNIAV